MSSKISNEAVNKGTGKIWSEWVKIINNAGGKKMSHKELAKWLYDNYDLSGWWSQMITVQYENDIKGRKKHEKPGGFEISKTKTFYVPVPKLYAAWSRMNTREKWLDHPHYKLRKATIHHSMRITWVDERTGLNVYFYDKGENKSSVSVQHTKLKTSSEAEKMKKYWKNNLDNLKNYLIKK